MAPDVVLAALEVNEPIITGSGLGWTTKIKRSISESASTPIPQVLASQGDINLPTLSSVEARLGAAALVIIQHTISSQITVRSRSPRAL